MSYGILRSTKLLIDGRYEQALAQADEEIAAQPAEPEAYFNRGQALVGLERHSDAADDFERALRLDASASSLDGAAVDDELFAALRAMALALKDAAPAEAIATLERYRVLLPAGRHLGDVATWVDHINGVDPPWIREHV